MFPDLELLVEGSLRGALEPAGNGRGFWSGYDSIIHITTSLGEAVIRKCQRNLEAGAKPIILTVADGVPVALGLAKNAELAGRIDIMDAEQFLAANLHEIALFKTSERRTTLGKLIETYNRIVSENETDPNLRIELS